MQGSENYYSHNKHNTIPFFLSPLHATSTPLKRQKLFFSSKAYRNTEV